MMQALPAPLRKLLAVGLLGVAGLAAYLLVVVPGLAHIDGLAERLEAERQLMTRYSRAVAAAGDALAAEAANTSPAAIDGSVYFLAGENASVMAARLQGLVREIGERHEVSMNTLRDLPPRQLDDLVLIGLEASFEAPLAELQRLLVDIEGAKPVLFLHELHIAAQPENRSRAERRTSENPLAVRISVYAALPDPEKRS